MDINDDGSVIVGHGTVVGERGTYRSAFRWTSETGAESLGLLPGGDTISVATAVSTDGATIVGYGDSEGLRQAYRWTVGDGFELLGEFTAFGVSDGGSVIVGTRDRLSPDSRAYIWDELNGARDLRYVLEVDFGLDLQGWILRDASDVSADGTVIVGRAINPSGTTQAFVAMIPEPSSVILLAVGILARMYYRKPQSQ